MNISKYHVVAVRKRYLTCTYLPYSIIFSLVQCKSLPSQLQEPLGLLSGPKTQTEIDPKNPCSGRSNRSFYPIKFCYRGHANLRPDPNSRPGRISEISKTSNIYQVHISVSIYFWYFGYSLSFRFGFSGMFSDVGEKNRFSKI